MPYNWIAIDQYGSIVTLYNTEHPRKKLMEKTYSKHAQKIYVGDRIHVGYKIGASWYYVYKLTAIGVAT